MSQYETTLDPAATNTSHGMLLALVGGNKTVLDVGCATGYLAEALGAAGCVVSGIEYDADAAEKARPFLDHLVVGDLITLDLDAAFGDRRYDVIVLGDVLEHLPDPAPVLARLTGLLAPRGSVVVSVPNVTHGSLRLALLQGRWQYRDLGLLDRTHLRFFTRESLLALLATAGLVVTELRTTTLDPLGSEVEVDAADLPPGVVEWVREQPDALTYQFVMRAVRDDSEGAALSAARERDELRQRLRDLEARAAKVAAERDAALAGLASLEKTATMRLLRPARRGWGAVRRRLGGGE